MSQPNNTVKIEFNDKTDYDVRDAVSVVTSKGWLTVRTLSTNYHYKLSSIKKWSEPRSV